MATWGFRLKKRFPKLIRRFSTYKCLLISSAIKSQKIYYNLTTRTLRPRCRLPNTTSFLSKVISPGSANIQTIINCRDILRTEGISCHRDYIALKEKIRLGHVPPSCPHTLRFCHSSEPGFF